MVIPLKWLSWLLPIFGVWGLIDESMGIDALSCFVMIGIGVVLIYVFGDSESSSSSTQNKASGSSTKSTTTSAPVNNIKPQPQKAPERLTCKNCGAEITKDTIYCAKCGNKVD